MLEKMRRSAAAIIAAFALCLLFAAAGFAEPVSAETVRVAAMNWLAEKANHMEEPLGDAIEDIRLYRGGQSGTIGYYLVAFAPNGWVIMPADDEFWPVQSFGPGKMTPALFEKTLWYAITSFSETAAARGGGANDKAAETMRKNQRRWKSLTEPGMQTRRAADLSAAADIRVDKLLGSEAYWGQLMPFNKLTYFKNLTRNTTINTPLAAASEMEFPVGCVALSSAMIMSHLANDPRYFASFIGSNPQVRDPQTMRDFFIRRDFRPVLDDDDKYGFNAYCAATSYDWQKIHGLDPRGVNFFAADQNDPGFIVSRDIKENLAPLLHDLGITLGATYREAVTVALFSARAVYLTGFSYAQSVLVYEPNPRRILPEDRDNIVQTNLDLGHPVGVGFCNKSQNGDFLSGHAAVADAYAYDRHGGTDVDYDNPYYHICTGWSYVDSNGYLSPDHGGWSYGLWGEISPLAGSIMPIGPDGGYWNIQLLYNVFPTQPSVANQPVGQPQIVSGRVVLASADDPGVFEPVPDAKVYLSWDGARQESVVANMKGIFAAVAPHNKAITLEIVSQDERLLKTIETDTNISVINTLDHVVNDPADVAERVGNRWLGDVPVTKVVVLRGTYDSVGDVLRDMRIAHEVVSHDRFISQEYVLPAYGVLFAEGDDVLRSATSDIDKFSKIFTKIEDFVKAGGSVVTTENTHDLANSLMGPAPVGMIFRAPGELPVFGPNTYMVEVTLGVQAQAAVGGSTVRTVYNYPMIAHTILEHLGNADEQGTGFYILINGWDLTGAEYPTMAYGTFADGGLCYWSSHPLGMNYFNNGEEGKKLAEFQINWILGSALSSSRRNGEAGSALQPAAREMPGGRGSLKRGLDGGYEYTGGRGVFTFESMPESGRQPPLLVALDGVRSRDVEIRKIGNDLLLCMNGLSRRVDFPGWYDGGCRIRSLAFADGTEWSAAELESRAVPSEPLRNLTLVQAENEIAGSEADDNLSGTGLNDVFVPGAGNDTMTGAGGCDVYYREPGGGDDTIVNAGSTGIGGILRFHEDIASADVKVSRQGDDLLFTLADGSVRVKDWYGDSSAKLGRAEFLGDMSALDSYDLELLAAGKNLVPRDEYRDTAVEVKPYAEYKASGAGGDKSAPAGGCNAGAAALAVMGLAAAAVAVRIKRGYFTRQQ